MGRGTRPWFGLLNVLGDETRWRIYEQIRHAGRPLSRQEVAERVGIPVRLAAFHLERLLEVGMLTANYARPPGRSGPGAGRTAKYYAPTDLELDLSIPQRRYELVGTMLVQALQATAQGEPAYEAASSVAAGHGREIGEGTGQRRPRRAEHQRRRTLTNLLEDLAYEPYHTPEGGIALRNCPFHFLARRAPELVCAMNHAFLSGILDGLGEDEFEALLACRQPGDCCVIFEPQASDAANKGG
ncbi:MAG: helix-turn-helix transcriptional regulator [Nitriliruptorales bacterium]